MGTRARRLLKHKGAGCKRGAGPDVEGGRKVPAARGGGRTAGEEVHQGELGVTRRPCLQGCPAEMAGTSLNDWKVSGRPGLGIRSEIYGTGNQVPEEAYGLRPQG